MIGEGIFPTEIYQQVSGLESTLNQVGGKDY
jgi:hypothetical protein